MEGREERNTSDDEWITDWWCAHASREFIEISWHITLALICNIGTAAADWNRLIAIYHRHCHSHLVQPIKLILRNCDSTAFLMNNLMRATCAFLAWSCKNKYSFSCTKRIYCFCGRMPLPRTYKMINYMCSSVSNWYWVPAEQYPLDGWIMWVFKSVSWCVCSLDPWNYEFANH